MQRPRSEKPKHFRKPAPQIPITPARHAVVEALLRQVERFPDLDPAPLRDGSLPARDAAFAHAIYDAAIRQWLTLSHVLSRRLHQPFEEQKPGVQAVLLAASAQILLLDKVPPHAAINEAVNWAKLRLSGSLAGMINGVLRNIVRLVLTDRAQGDELAQPVRRAAWSGARAELPLPDGRALVFKLDIMPEEEWEHLSVTTSCPPGLLAHWRNEQGDEAARRLATHLLAEPPTILNVAHASEATLAALSAGTPPLSVPHAQPGARVWHGPRQELAPMLGAHRDVWVQDPSSIATVAALHPFRDEVADGVIVDMCAGHGTKTRQLAATFPNATIIATDVDPDRLASLRGIHLANVKVVAPEALAEAASEAALVLADVPCSNSGVLARRPEAKYRWSEAQSQRLQGIQREILAQAASLVRPGGLLVYATCSMDKGENEDQAGWAVAELGLRVEAEVKQSPAGDPGGKASEYHDASYSVHLRSVKGPGDSRRGTGTTQAGTLKARRAKTASKKRPGSRA